MDRGSVSEHFFDRFLPIDLSRSKLVHDPLFFEAPDGVGEERGSRDAAGGEKEKQNSTRGQ